MMKATRLVMFSGGLLLGMAAGTASAAFVAPDSHTSLQQTILLVKHGADDRKPPQCDDHGTDLCATPDSVAKHGADDLKPPQCDDHGTDLCATRAGVLES